MTSKNSILIALFVVFGASAVFAGSAEEAWTKLVGTKMASRAAFAFVKNDPALPNVLVYGDSISIAYTPQVRKSLAGKANVYRLYCNGGDSSSVIGKMKQMHSVMGDETLDRPWAFQWDVIHFNVGLHDLKYLADRKLDKKNGKQVSSIEDYQTKLKAIIAYFHEQFPKAQLIFATTTPVPEGEPGRVAGDAKIYNAAALAVLRDYPEIKINDLFAFTEPNHSKWWTKPGNVHYNTTGSSSQGDEVARQILAALPEAK